MKRESGITLVALIITIILLLILSGVVISLTLGENGILNRAEQSGEEYRYQAAKEKLQIKIMDLQAEKVSTEYREATLQDLKELEIKDKQIDQVQLDNDTNPKEAFVDIDGYTFTVDDKLNIIDGHKSSDKIKAFCPEIVLVGVNQITIKAETTSREGNIISYAFYINGELKKVDSNNTYLFENGESNTEYVIYVIATDDKGNSKESIHIKQRTKKELIFTKEVLQNGKVYEAANVVITDDRVSITGKSVSKTPDYRYVLRWYDQMDLTDYSKLTFYAKKGATHGSVWIYIDGELILNIWYPDFSTNWQKIEIDISGYTGVHEIGIGGGYADSTGSPSSNTQYSDIRLTN